DAHMATRRQVDGVRRYILERALPIADARPRKITARDAHATRNNDDAKLGFRRCVFIDLAEAKAQRFEADIPPARRLRGDARDGASCARGLDEQRGAHRTATWRASASDLPATSADKSR